MKEELKDILFKSLQTPSPSGNEEQVIDLFSSFIAPYVDSIQTDVFGNCIAHKKGPGPKVLIMAHADEIGLMIIHIDENGFLYFKEVGGIDTDLLPGHRVSIQGISQSVIGIIGKKPIHLQDKADGNKELKAEDLWIDIAANNKQEAEAMVEIGSMATIISKPIGMSGNLVSSKSLDDKIGLAVLMGVALNLSSIHTDKDVYLVASVQEEIGARGAQPATNSIHPDIGIAVDVTHATDYPTMSSVKDGDIRLGRGVVIPVGPNMNKELVNAMKRIAAVKCIPIQLEAIARPTGTDARMIQITGSGVQTGLVSIPCRYMHTPNEIVSLSDADAAIDLLTEYLSSSQ